jgi:L-fuconate dehydratase
MHMAIGGIVSALWDLRAKREGTPLWRLLSSSTPEEIVDLVDFRYLTDALTREEALGIPRSAAPGRAARLLDDVFPAYTSTPGWPGYDGDKPARLCRAAVAEGFGELKREVGGDLGDDFRHPPHSPRNGRPSQMSDPRRRADRTHPRREKRAIRR